MSHKWRIPEWFQYLDSGVLDKLQAFHSDLCRWTIKVNLISPSTIDESDRIHIADGILGYEKFKDFVPDYSEVWDLGSGNGIPGVVVAILNPSLKVKCLDSDERKISFIRQIGFKLGLNNLSTICERLEKVEEDAIPMAMARGFADISKTLKLCHRKISSGGVIFHFKGSDWASEISQSNGLGWKSELLSDFRLPQAESGLSESRAIVRSERN